MSCHIAFFYGLYNWPRGGGQFSCLIDTKAGQTPVLACQDNWAISRGLRPLFLGESEKDLFAGRGWISSRDDKKSITQGCCEWFMKIVYYPRISHPAAAATKLLQSCPTLCDPIDGSPPGSAIPGILQARTLEWVAISFSNPRGFQIYGRHQIWAVYNDFPTDIFWSPKKSIH